MHSTGYAFVPFSVHLCAENDHVFSFNRGATCIPISSFRMAMLFQSVRIRTQLTQWSVRSAGGILSPVANAISGFLNYCFSAVLGKICDAGCCQLITPSPSALTFCIEKCLLRAVFFFNFISSHSQCVFGLINFFFHLQLHWQGLVHNAEMN